MAPRELVPKHPFNLKILCTELCTATVHIFPVNLHPLGINFGGVSAPESNFKCPKSWGNGPRHEPKISKILLELCTEGTLGQFWRACRRRPNLAVGDAACGNLKWFVETIKLKRGVYSQAILQ